MASAPVAPVDTLRAFLRDAGRQAEVLEEHMERNPDTPPKVAASLVASHRIDAGIAAELALSVGIGTDTEELSYIRDELLNSDANLRVKSRYHVQFVKPAVREVRAVVRGELPPGKLQWSFRHTLLLYGMLFTVGGTQQGKAWLNKAVVSPPGGDRVLQETSGGLADFRSAVHELLTSLVGVFRLTSLEQQVALPASDPALDHLPLGDAQRRACVQAVHNHVRFLAWE